MSRLRRGNRSLILKGTSLVIRWRLCGTLVVSCLIYFRHFDRSKSPVDSAPFTEDCFCLATLSKRGEVLIGSAVPGLCLATLFKRGEVLLRSTVLSLCLAKVSKGEEVLLGSALLSVCLPTLSKGGKVLFVSTLLSVCLAKASRRGKLGQLFSMFAGKSTI